MYLSRESGFYDINGTEIYVPKNHQFADNDPAVRALPQIMDRISVDGPPPRPSRAEAKERAEAAKEAFR
jgi:hypothetical protein